MTGTLVQLTSSPVNGSLSSWVDGNWRGSCSPHHLQHYRLIKALRRHGTINNLMMSYRADCQSEHTKNKHTYTNQKCFHIDWVFFFVMCVFFSSHFELWQNCIVSNSTTWWAAKMTWWLIDQEGSPALFSQFWVHQTQIGHVLCFWCSGGLVIQESKINQTERRGWGVFHNVLPTNMIVTWHKVKHAKKVREGFTMQKVKNNNNKNH